MRIEISTKHITLSQEAKDKIIDKLLRLSHIVSDEHARLDLEVIHTTEHHKKGVVFEVEARLHSRGNLLKAGCEGEAILSCVDKVEDELKRQLLKKKEKRAANERTTRRIVREMRGKE